MTEEDIEPDMEEGENLLQIAGMENAPVNQLQAVAAIALNMAMKYHDINTVQDGTLYQQYKLEGKNFIPLHLDAVFETATRIEAHLLTSKNRMSEIIYDTLIKAMVKEVAEDADRPDEPS